MTINALRNKRYGPGGGTRRLHHLQDLRKLSRIRYGAEIGSTCVVKVVAFVRHCTAVIGLLLQMLTTMRLSSLNSVSLLNRDLT